MIVSTFIGLVFIVLALVLTQDETSEPEKHTTRIGCVEGS